MGVTAPCREGTVASPTSLGFERGTIGAADESDDPVLRALNRATQLEGRVSVDGQTKEFQRALVSTIRCRLHHEPEVHIGRFPHMWLAFLSKQWVIARNVMADTEDRLVSPRAWKPNGCAGQNENVRKRNSDLETRLDRIETELGIDARTDQRGVADD